MANPHQGFFAGRQPHGLPTNKQPDDEDELTYLGTVSSHRPTPQIEPLLWTLKTDPRFQHTTTQALPEHRSTPLIQKQADIPPRVWKIQADPGSPRMPYNNTAIPPSEEITGSAALPRKVVARVLTIHQTDFAGIVARVKKILGLDEDIHQCSNNGAFAITVATVGIRELLFQSHA